MKAATWGDLKKFFAADRWRLERTIGDAHYEKLPADGTMLRSKRSLGKDHDAIGSDLFRQILRLQLRISESDFWEAIRTGAPAARPSTPPRPPAALPAWLVERLRREVGLGDPEIFRMSESDARRRLEEHRSRSR